MRPFRVNPRKKNLQLKKSSFNLKDFVAKIFESPDKMYPKLQSMLSKNSDTLHAFVELGGLSKIYEYLQHYYHRNDELQIIKWLKILNHEHFPVDTELIKQIGLTNFINKQIKSKWKHNNDSLISLITSIEQKWIKELKEQKKQINERDPNRKRVSYPSQYEKQVVFKKYDKPITINNKRSSSRSKSSISISTSSSHTNPTPILIKKTSTPSISSQFNGMDDFHGRDLMEFEDTEYTLEYVEDNDVDMDGNDDKYESTDDEDDDIDLNRFRDSPKITPLRNNNNDECNDIDMNGNGNANGIILNGHNDNINLIEDIEWYTPIMIKIDNDFIKNIVNDTDATRKEEERIKDKELVNNRECIELDSAKIRPNLNEMNGKECSVEVPADYPHVCHLIYVI